VTVASHSGTSESLPASPTHDSDHAECRGVIIPTPLVEFSERSLYSARIAFLRGAMAISKIDGHFFISSFIGLKFYTHLEDDNAHIRVGRNFEFPPLKNLAPL